MSGEPTVFDFLGLSRIIILLIQHFLISVGLTIVGQAYLFFIIQTFVGIPSY